MSPAPCEAHPYDFAETTERAVQIVHGVNKSWFNYEFCCPHLFHRSQGRGNASAMMEYAGERLQHVHIDDVFNHLANVENRYINNAPVVDARVHQHNEIGIGEVPWDECLRLSEGDLV